MKRKIILAAAIAGAIAALLLAYYVYNSLTRNIIDKLVFENKMINVLVAGSNSFRDNKHRFFAIVSVNPEMKKMGVTFLPPNFRIDPDGSGGHAYRLEDVGLDDFKMLSRALSRELKLNIPFYIELYSLDVKRMVNLIEGIDLFVLNQNQFIKDLPFGLNYFDGDMIVRYINQVENDSIYKKYDRIQDILITLYLDKEKLKKFKNADFIEELFRSVKTNLLSQELVSFADLLYRDNSLDFTMVPGNLGTDNFYSMDTIAYKIYENEFLKKLVIKEKSKTPVKVKVLNGTTIPGLALRLRSILVKEGLSVVEFGTSPFPPVEKTVIINQKGNIENVQRVASIVGKGTVHHVVDSSQLHSVMIIVGKDFAK